MFLRHKYLTLVLLFTLLPPLSSCSGDITEDPQIKKRAEPEVSVPAMPSPVVEREDLGDVFALATTARGGDRIVTTKRWVIESASVFPFRDLKEGDWVDLITVRTDEKNVFQYLCVAEVRECRRVIRIRKLLPDEGDGAALREIPPARQ